MNRLDLDFAPRNARFWWARASLALRAAALGSVLALLVAVGLLMSLHAQRLELQDALARMAPAAAPAQGERPALASKGAQARDAAHTQALDQAMNQAVMALNRPWAALWDALERVSSAPGVQVAILEMRPDTASATQDPGAAQGLRLLAESKDSAHMLGFMRELRAEPFFVSAVLSSHQVNAQDPYKPLRFEVTLQWKQAAL
jgi:hypothetical protein